MLVFCGLLALGGTSVLGDSDDLTAPPVPEATDRASRIERRARELEPTAEERRIDKIGWARGILEAERLAKARHRPVFLFTLDGRMDIGRC